MIFARMFPALVAAVLAAGPVAADEPTASPVPVASASPAAFPAPSAAAAAPARAGMPAPAFSLRTIDGKTVTLADYAGKTLVINVWATWCPPCRQEMPDLIASAPGFAKDGSVAFLGVDTTEDAPIVRAYAASRGVPYALAIDTGSAFAKAYDIEAFPTTFVVDAHGIVRARYVDVLAKRQLAELVAAGKAGRDAQITSPLQAKIDGVLTDPAIAFTSNDPATIEANAKAADTAIDKAESLLDDSDAAKGKSTDFTRTRLEESALRAKAIAALVNYGTSVKDKALLPKLSGDQARDGERWSDAVDAYRAVLGIDPKNEDALEGIAYASARLGKYGDAVDAQTRLVALEPGHVTPLVVLGLDQAKSEENADAYATFARAIDLGKHNVAASHEKPSEVRSLAYAYLYAGRTFAKAGEIARARDDFSQLLYWTQKLPADDERHDMYLEEGQEAIAALGLGAPSGLTVSLAPWIGADLPGSIPNTIKYRLVLAGVAGKNVTLKAMDVPKDWVASFCSDKVCAPFRVGVAIPPSGVKIVEFQLVPPGAKYSAPRVRVTGTDGKSEAFATT
jgi:peroxiredoxin